MAEPLHHDADDLALANACYEVERESRDRGFKNLERLGALVAGDVEPDADLDARIRALPESEFFSAARCVLDLGWVD